jgi:hypothetical protein
VIRVGDRQAKVLEEMSLPKTARINGRSDMANIEASGE